MLFFPLSQTEWCDYILFYEFDFVHCSLETRMVHYLNGEWPEWNVKIVPGTILHLRGRRASIYFKSDRFTTHTGFQLKVFAVPEGIRSTFLITMVGQTVALSTLMHIMEQPFR